MGVPFQPFTEERLRLTLLAISLRLAMGFPFFRVAMGFPFFRVTMGFPFFPVAMGFPLFSGGHVIFIVRIFVGTEPIFFGVPPNVILILRI